MTNIINVDFKNKTKIAEHTTYQWVDALDGKIHSYDSRVKTNLEHFSLPIFILDQKQNRAKLNLFFSLESFKTIYKELTGE